MPLNAFERHQVQAGLTALADGDRAAFAPLFERLWPIVRAFVVRQLPFEEAEDVAQQTLVKVFARAAEFDPERDALAWVLGVALWEVRTARRRRTRRREDTLGAALDERPTDVASPEQAAIARDREQALEEVLGSLRPEEVATLRAFADDRRPPGSAFRKRLERALARLRAAWRTSHVG
jgi:RNA polymerase sigma-70 factor (ECF subfamily)